MGEKPNIVLLGMPGSGKSTIARAIADQGYEYISSGEIARAMARDDIATHDALQDGDYAPEAAMRLEIISRIEAAELIGRPFVLDGFPRLLEQLIVLEKALPQPPIYIEIVAPPIDCIRRIVQRGREGEHPDAIASRMRAYESDTKPMIEALMPSDILMVKNFDLNASVKLVRSIVGQDHTQRQDYTRI